VLLQFLRQIDLVLDSIKILHSVVCTLLCPRRFCTVLILVCVLLASLVANVCRKRCAETLKFSVLDVFTKKHFDIDCLYHRQGNEQKQVAVHQIKIPNV
jgi:hypothetical protein